MKNRSPRIVSCKWIPFFYLSFFLFGMFITFNGRFVSDLLLYFLDLVDVFLVDCGIRMMLHDLGAEAIGFARCFSAYNTSSNSFKSFLKEHIEGYHEVSAKPLLNGMLTFLL